MRLGELIAGLDVEVLIAPGGQRVVPSQERICDLTEDSRTILPGSLFIARKGEKSDGKAFIQQALKAGAVCIVCDDRACTLGDQPASSHATLLFARDIQLVVAQLGERFFGSPSTKLTLMGVTGTNGKTTTTYLMHQMLNALGIRTGMIGTVVIDDGVEVAPASLTTPPALEVSRTLARMLDAGCEAAVMEASSHSLHQRRVGALKFAAGVFTNLTGDHLDYHGTMEAYADAKAMLFAALGKEGVAIVNNDDPAHARMIRDCGARVVRCGLGRDSNTGSAADRGDWLARATHADTRATRIEFSGSWGTREVNVPLVGAFNVMNALQAAASVYEVFGVGRGRVTIDGVLGALERVQAPPGRLEPVTREGDPISVLVDYAHTDDALRTVLSVLRDAMQRSGKPGKLWCVFGCGGDRDRTKRPRMGKVASELSDVCIITSDNPRTEDAASIIGHILDGISDVERRKVSVEPDRALAIAQALREAHAGDVVIIAGKGHEDYQILPDPSSPGKTIAKHFDDREHAREGLNARSDTQRAAAAGMQAGEDDEAETLQDAWLDDDAEHATDADAFGGGEGG